MEYFYTLLDLIQYLFDTHSSKTLAWMNGIAVFAAVCLYLLSIYFTKLWNKEFTVKPTHHLPCILAAVITYFSVISFFAVQHLEGLANSQIQNWAYHLINDNDWAKNTYQTAYNEVKTKTEESFGEVPPIDSLGTYIPVNSFKAKGKVGNIYSNALDQHFESQLPFLDIILGISQNRNQELLTTEIQQYFQVNNTEDDQWVVADYDDFDGRLIREGAKGGDIQISLKWDNYNDLDLHCVDTNGEEIYFSHKKSKSGGELDVDMNAGSGASNKPVENIYWARNTAPEGQYIVKVVFYSKHDQRLPTDYQVRIWLNGIQEDYTGTVSTLKQEVVVDTLQYVSAPEVNDSPYDISKGIQSMVEASKAELTAKAPRIVWLSRVFLFLFFLLFQLIPFGWIGYSAYKDLTISV